MDKWNQINQDAEWLGAEKGERNSFLAVFVPSKDRDGEPVDGEYWRSEAVRTLSALFGGATSIQAYGGWLDVERNNSVLEESVFLVFSYFAEDRWEVGRVKMLRDFLYRMGRETKQGEIGIVVKGKYLPIQSDKYERKQHEE